MSRCLAPQVEDATYTNPVIASNSPDPGVLRLPGDQGFVAVTTSNFALRSRGDPAFPLHHSWDLVRRPAPPAGELAAHGPRVPRRGVAGLGRGEHVGARHTAGRREVHGLLHRWG